VAPGNGFSLACMVADIRVGTVAVVGLALAFGHRALLDQATVPALQGAIGELGKRGLIYRTGSFAKGTQEAHRSPRCSAKCVFAKQSATYKGRPLPSAPRSWVGSRRGPGFA
jgi:hypothetical protein